MKVRFDTGRKLAMSVGSRPDLLRLYKTPLSKIGQYMPDGTDRQKEKNCLSSGLENKKLRYRRVTARCILSVVILPITTQQYIHYLNDKS